MPFTEFASLTDFKTRFRIAEAQADLLPHQPQSVSARTQAYLDFVHAFVSAQSEPARCEFLIAPMLMEGLEPFVADLSLHSHRTLSGTEPLRGVPDYIVARRSELGRDVLEQPYVLVSQAKLDDFDGGWGQCAAAMLAAQRLNGQPDFAVWGIVTNGRLWEFGRLVGSLLTLHSKTLRLADLPEVCGALRHVFGQCAAAARQFQPAAAA